MYVQGVESIFDLDWNGRPASHGGKLYRDIFHQAEQEYSAYNFECADTRALLRHFEDAEAECTRILAAPPVDPKTGNVTVMVRPAYDQCIKASHCFNLLDARGLISVNERQALIGRVRSLAKACADALMAASEPEPVAAAAGVGSS